MKVCLSLSQLVCGCLRFPFWGVLVCLCHSLSTMQHNLFCSFSIMHIYFRAYWGNPWVCTWLHACRSCNKLTCMICQRGWSKKIAHYQQILWVYTPTAQSIKQDRSGNCLPPGMWCFTFVGRMHHSCSSCINGKNMLFQIKIKVTASLWQKWLLLSLVATHRIDKEPLCSPLPPRNWQKFLELSDFWKIFASLSNRNILDFLPRGA